MGLRLDYVVKWWNLSTWGFSPRLGMCSYFSRFILGFNGVMLLVVDDVSVNSEAPVVTS